MFWLIVIAILIGLAVILAIKNYVTYKNRVKIIYAIRDYLLRDDNYDIDAVEVSFNDMEKYNYTFLRLWDWGYKHILPKEKYEVIKRYIK